MQIQFFIITLLTFSLLKIVNCGVQQVNQTQLWFENQIVNHNDPLDNRTWSQRYWLIDEFYNPEKGPVILYICGEYTCPGLPEERLWPADIAQMYEGLILVLEHRYYGNSMPLGPNSLHTDNMHLLTVDQALSDLAYFIMHNKKSGAHNIKPTSPWLTIGGSYPGAMSAWFRYKYPHLTIGALASSAVIDSILEFTQFDEQMKASTLKSGDWCPQAIHDLNEYAQKQVMNPQTSHSFKAGFNATEVENDQFLFYYADIFVGYVQYGKRTWLCDQLKGHTVLQNSVFIEHLANQDGLSVEEYSSYYNSNDSYVPTDPQGHRQWLYQYCSEVGWFQIAPKVDALRSQYVDMNMYTNLCKQSFENIDIFPQVDRINLQYGGLDMEAFNIIFTNGVEDPWKHASLLKSKNDMIAIEIDCPDCAHCVDLYTPKESDAQTLKNARKVQIENITKWLKEHNKKLNTQYNTEPKQQNEVQQSE